MNPCNCWTNNLTAMYSPMATIISSIWYELIITPPTTPYTHKRLVTLHCLLHHNIANNNSIMLRTIEKKYLLNNEYTLITFYYNLSLKSSAHRSWGSTAASTLPCRRLILFAQYNNCAERGEQVYTHRTNVRHSAAISPDMLNLADAIICMNRQTISQRLALQFFVDKGSLIAIIKMFTGLHNICFLNPHK